MNIDLGSIGRILREKREEKGFSVTQISDKLCLRKSLIEAIEAGNWSPLPHEVYVKGFVKEYAAILDAYDAISPFLSASAPEGEKAAGKEQAPEERTVREQVLKETAPKETRKASREDRIESRPKRRFSRAKFAYFGILIVVMFFFVYDRMEKERTLTTKTEKASQAAETAHRPSESTAPLRSVSELNHSEEPGKLPSMAEAKRLMITCHERTWVSVVIDGKEKKEFMMSPQEIIMLNATERFDLLIGNAGGVKLILNGKDTEFAGKSGEVKRLQLS